MTTLSKRIISCTSDGAIRRHYKEQPNLTINRKHMDNNTAIIQRQYKVRIKVTGAVYTYINKS